MMKVTSSQEILKNKLFSVVDEIARDPDGFEIHRSIIRHPGSAVMMAVDEKNRVLLVEQFRLPAERKLWELPAGRLDAGETPLRAAKRELKEETGYSAKTWTKLASFWPSPGYVAEKMTIFLATDLKSGAAEPMDDERIEARWFTRREMNEAIVSGKIADGKTLIGYYSWLRMKNCALTGTLTRWHAGLRSARGCCAGADKRGITDFSQPIPSSSTTARCAHNRTPDTCA